MVSLKDLAALDRDGSFDRIRKQVEESASKEEERAELLTQVVVSGLVNHFLVKKAKENQHSTKKATRVSFEKKKRHDKRSYGECVDEEKNVVKKSKIIKNVKNASPEIHPEKEKEAKKPNSMPLMNKNKNYFQELFSNRLPILPHDMKSHIQRKGIDVINDVKLVIVKELTVSDLLEKQGRLTMPVIQAISHEFLTADDKQTLDHGGTIPVTLIEPCLTETPVNLRKWQLTSSWSYSLVSGWKDILLKRKVDNGLVSKAILQVCWFRTDNGKKLWLALSIIDKKVVEGMRCGASTSNSSDGSDAGGGGGIGSSSRSSTMIRGKEEQV